MEKPLHLSQLLMQRYLPPGGRALDATAGNGYDLLTLSRLAGEGGMVEAFDIQEEALNQSRQRLAENGCYNVRYHLACHSRIEELLSEKIHLGVFNLGYLPGSDKQITTKAESSQKALAAALKLLRPQGALLVMIYTGHPAALREARTLLSWAKKLPPREVQVLYYSQINKAKNREILLIIEKLQERA